MKVLWGDDQMDECKETKDRKDRGVVERIFALMDYQGVTDRDIEEYLCVGRGMVSHWRNDGRNSYLQFINAICEYLQTTPNYLFQGYESRSEPDIISPMERELIQMYRKTDDEQQKFIKDGLRLLTREQK